MKRAGILSLVLLVGLGILSFIVIVGLSDRLVATQSALEFSVGVNERGVEIIEHAVAVAKTLNNELAQERVIKETAMTEVEDLRAELRQETARKEVALAVLKLIKRDLESSLEEERRLSEEKLATLNSQFKAATEESMRVEGRLTEELSKVPRNPTLEGLKVFLAQDKTNMKDWSVEYNCGDFSADLDARAEAAGYEAGFAWVIWEFRPEGKWGHFMNAFTLDSGEVVFVEPQTDEILKLEVGGNFTDGTVKQTIKQILIAW